MAGWLKFLQKGETFYPDLEIFALSGFLYDFDKKEFEDAGFDGFYEKPISRVQLEELLDTDI